MTTRKIATLQHSIFSELGEAWIKDGLVAEEILYDILSSHVESPDQFEAIREQGVIPEVTLLQDLASSMACPYWDNTSLREAATPQLVLATKIPRNILEDLCVLPISLKDGNLQIAISSWPTQKIFVTLQNQLSAQNVVFGFAERSSILDVLSYALAEVNDRTQAMSSVNSDLFGDSWDDWEEVPSLASQQEIQTQSQHEIPEPTPKSSSVQASVDDLLADFLTPDMELPATSSGVFQSRTSTDSFARSLPAVDAVSAQSSDRLSQSSDRLSPSSSPSIRSAPRILSASSPSLETGAATGLAALGSSQSNAEWTPHASSSSSLKAHRSSPSLGGPTISPINQTPSILTAEVAEARQENIRKHRTTKKKQRDASSANLMAFVMTIVRLLVIAGIGYLVYLGYQNGI